MTNDRSSVAGGDAVGGPRRSAAQARTVGGVLPTPRGPCSDMLIAALRNEVGRAQVTPPGRALDPFGEDLHLALYVAHELGYRGFVGVSPDWELDAGLASLVRSLDATFLDAVEAEVGPVSASTPDEVRDELLAVASGDGPSLSRWVDERGTLAQLREFAAHRSAYQLKEADPHTLAIARLAPGRAKDAFVEIQTDEYGGGRPGESHQELFGGTLRALGLDDRYGAYLDHLPAATLATVNLTSALAATRARLGDCVGHLALFEMTSVGPMARYARAVRRLTGSDAGARFYDVHVLADQHHEQLALHQMVVPFVEDEPAHAAAVVRGARALAMVEGRFAAHLLERWRRGECSLRRPLAVPSPPGTVDAA
jgi:hypothetical protein